MTTSAPQPARNGAGAGPWSVLACSRMVDVAIVHKFLREVGIPSETVDEFSCAELRG